jgi:hypothetical protein
MRNEFSNRLVMNARSRICSAKDPVENSGHGHANGPMFIQRIPIALQADLAAERVVSIDPVNTFG